MNKFIEFLPEPVAVEFLNMSLNDNILESIKDDIYKKMYDYNEFIPVEFKRNTESKFKWHSDVVESLFKDLKTYDDLSHYLIFSLKNKKLGNKILRVNKSPYFLCDGLLNGWCTCTKQCYAGKLEHFQLNSNLKNYIFIEYVKKTGNKELLEMGIIRGVNDAVDDVNGCFSDIKAIRNDEAGEISDLKDLRVFEYIYDFLRQFKSSLRDYTYSTNPYLIDEFKDSPIVIRKSAGFEYDLIDSSLYSDWSAIINTLDDLKTLYDIAIKNNLNIMVCGGSCKCCLACTKKNTIIVFVNHSKTTEKQLKVKIEKAQAFLRDLKGCE